MNKSTVVTIADAPTYESESHTNYVTRYFNGRRFDSIVEHHFMSCEVGADTPEAERIYWLIRAQFTTIKGIRPFTYTKIGFTHAQQSMTGPSVLRRAMNAMIPGDNQEVPF